MKIEDKAWFGFIGHLGFEEGLYALHDVLLALTYSLINEGYWGLKLVSFFRPKNENRIRLRFGGNGITLLANIRENGQCRWKLDGMETRGPCGEMFPVKKHGQMIIELMMSLPANFLNAVAQVMDKPRIHQKKMAESLPLGTQSVPHKFSYKVTLNDPIPVFEMGLGSLLDSIEKKRAEMRAEGKEVGEIGMKRIPVHDAIGKPFPPYAFEDQNDGTEIRAKKFPIV